MSGKGVPTKYAGIQFRSRLEAQWAAFFDGLGWGWEYEPFDLDGYIPDFVLHLERPLLVEVKPETELAALSRHFEKIYRAGWAGASMVVGASIFRDGKAFAYGRIRDSAGTQPDITLDHGAQFYDSALATRCLARKCVETWSIESSGGDWQCWRCPGHRQQSFCGRVAVDPRPVWAAAKNAVQWKGSDRCERVQPFRYQPAAPGYLSSWIRYTGALDRTLTSGGSLEGIIRTIRESEYSLEDKDEAERYVRAYARPSDPTSSATPRGPSGTGTATETPKGAASYCPS